MEIYNATILKKTFIILKTKTTQPGNWFCRFTELMAKMPDFKRDNFSVEAESEWMCKGNSKYAHYLYSNLNKHIFPTEF